MRLIIFLFVLCVFSSARAEDPIRSVEIATTMCEKVYAPQFAYQYGLIGAKFIQIRSLENALDKRLSDIADDPKLSAREKTRQSNDSIKSISPEISDLRKNLTSDLEKLTDSFFIEIKERSVGSIYEQLSIALVGSMKSKTFVMALEDSKSGRRKSQIAAEMELRMGTCYPNNK